MEDDLLIAALQAKLVVCAERLRKSEERAVAGQLALEMMHDIRGPLEALANLTYLAQYEAERPAEVHKYLRSAEEQMATLSGIVGRGLGFARVSAACRPVKLAGVAEAALRIHRRELEAKHIHLVKQLPEDYVATVQAGEMLQVVSNLISNALDALPRGGILQIRLRRRWGQVQLVIADNGHGIPNENTSEVFEPFFTTKGENGNGLGLSLSRRLVEKHRGNIKVKSCIKPGRSGTVFVVSLPT